jgi:hypothetical protein
MKILRCLLLAGLLAGYDTSAVSQIRVMVPDRILDRQIRFAREIERYLLKDRIEPPSAGGIEFIGSSIFRLWTHLEEQMAPLPVFNRAFGGSQTGEVLHYMDTLVLRYHPSIIVYYCGSNDVNAGEPAEKIANRFIAFAERVRSVDPATRIFYVSITRAPQKRNRWMVVDSANALVEKYCGKRAGRTFIDVNPLLFDEGGNPRLDLYRDDRLHFSEEGYVRLAGMIRPVLLHAWQNR